MKGRALAAIGATALVCLGAAAGAGASVRVAKVAQRPAKVRQYWTPARMRTAQPAGLFVSRGMGAAAQPGHRGAPRRVAPLSRGAVAAGSGLHTEVTHIRKFPKRTNGKVFFTQGVTDYQCSGTLVRSPNRSLVITAGHCVFEPGLLGAGFSTNFEFIPAYKNGKRPLGEWPATHLAATAQWKQSGNSSFDVGAAKVAENGHGKKVQDLVGARGIAFNQPRQQAYASFGYPAQSPPPEFDGRHLFRCDSGYGGDDPNEGSPRPMWINCDMTGGASGGGWVIHDKFVVSVNSYKYNGLPNRMYGPYFGNAVQSLYNSVKGGG